MNNAGLSAEGLSIDIDWDYADNPRRIGEVKATINIPNSDVGKRETAILKAANHCTIHNTLHNSPNINIDLKVG